LRVSTAETVLSTLMGPSWRIWAASIAVATFAIGVCVAGVLTQGGQGRRPAPLAFRLHSIPTHFLLNVHGV
jgi:hypothetical protein